jgi:4-amino-4-deoxy-L-arabinose transferase-like glycosyltransferase
MGDRVLSAHAFGATRRALAALPPWPLAIWLVLAVGGLVARPPLAPTEAQILSIAWEMRLDGSFLPRLGGVALDVHPPLLFWLIRAAWGVFGVSETAARLVAPLFALGALLLVGPFARLLWPDRRQAATLAGILLAGTGGFAAYSAMSLPALPVAFLALLGLYGLALAARGQAGTGWAVYGGALGLVFLAGGGSAALLLLGPALAAPLWRRPDGARGRTGWWLGFALALGGAVLLALIWIVPALGHGTPLLDLLLARSPREGSFGAPARPAHWLVLTLVLALYPWLLWKTLWRATTNNAAAWRDPGLRFALAAAVLALIVAFTASWREAEGLLPLMPPLALIAARLLDAGGRRPHDFHALLPGMVALLIGLVCFLLNIVPVAHLDAVWREFISERGLPIWLGGVSLTTGLVLLGGSYLLAQMTPAELVSRTVQLALMPVLLVSALNLEFAISLRDFFDLGPIAQEIHRLQESGRPVAVYGAYGGELGFSGRLEAPLPRLASPAQAIGWAADHPSGVVVSSFQGGYLRLPARPLYLGQIADNWAALWPAEAVTATDGAVLRSRF